ncbi:glucan endo-1,3-beta-glucosidase isoform X1 [Actinidia eriantha]|uniref:glucan endo-1,3-beta-glucosidase isoform X1 n=1 Tax=Actinidia eriantha TaxID=165200 RepID=UPI00258751FB|nr:glucan endo-1,3-beta-glucosidase isoform X1 [Actinidia eriantha]
MDKNAATPSLASTVSTVVVLLLASTLIRGVKATIGVNYGTVANNLPPPASVARFLLESTVINRVRLFDADPQLVQAFAHTGIALTITIPNDQIPLLTNLSFAQQWVKTTLTPQIPTTNIVRVLLGNEVLSTANKFLISTLVPAMQTLHTALVAESLDRRIKISTPHSLGILASSSPPSSGKFRPGYDTHVIKPLLSFLRATNSPFMINPYPFFGCSEETLDYALFRPTNKVFDEMSQRTYTNMLDGQLDAVFSAMKLLDFTDVEIVIAETGWPSKGDPGQVGVEAEVAAEYNSNLIKHVTSGVGTPLMPNRTFETFIFALFNEDLKPGPTCERNFGLFDPNMKPVYDIGILRQTARLNFPGNQTPVGKKWCVPKSGAVDEALQRNIDYVCGLGLDCGPVKEGGACFVPDTVQAHAAYVMNLYYQAMGRNDYDCDFEQTGAITNVDPSYGRCNY